ATEKVVDIPTLHRRRSCGGTTSAAIVSGISDTIAAVGQRSGASAVAATALEPLLGHHLALPDFTALAQRRRRRGDRCRLALALRSTRSPVRRRRGVGVRDVVVGRHGTSCDAREHGQTATSV